MGNLWPHEIGSVGLFGGFPQFYFHFSSNLAKLTTGNIGQLCVLNAIKCRRNVKNGTFGVPMCHLSFSEAKLENLTENAMLSRKFPTFESRNAFKSGNTNIKRTNRPWETCKHHPCTVPFETHVVRKFLPGFDDNDLLPTEMLSCIT